MSHKATAWAFEQRGLDAAAKLVLLYLADTHNGTRDDCFPSVAFIQEATGLSRRTIQRHFDTLRKHGLLAMEARARADGGRTSSRFYLLIDGPNATGDASIVGEPNAKFDTPPRHHDAGGGVTMTQPPGHHDAGGRHHDAPFNEVNQEGNHEINQEEITGTAPAGAGAIPDIDNDGEREFIAAISTAYADNIGELNRTFAQDIGEIWEEYGPTPEMAEGAVWEAVQNNKTTWNYVRVVLTRMAQEGRNQGRGPGRQAKG